jgi:MFS family permease
LKDETWNFTAALIDAAGWGLGMGLISDATFLPLFVHRLTASPLAIGAISSVMTFGWFMPGILVAGPIDRLPRVKTYVMAVAAVERLSLLAIAPLCVFLGPAQRPALLAAFFGCWLLMNLAMGCNIPSYYKLIAKTVPARRRGRLYGTGGAVAGLLGVAGGEFAGQLLQQYGYPRGFAACFGLAFLVQAASVLPLAWMREPVTPSAPPPPGRGGFLRDAVKDSRMRGLAAGHALFCGTLMAAAFYADFAIRRYAATPGTVAHFTAVSMAAQVVANLAIGWLGDRRGNRSALLLSSLAGVLAATLAWRAPSLSAMYAVFAFSRFATVGWGICWVNYVLEVSEPDRAASYVAALSAAVGPFRVLFPLAGALITERFGFSVLFAVAAALTLGSAVALFALVSEPRHDNGHAPSKGSRDTVGG